MASQTVYPYGTGGSLPTNIGLVNDLHTGGADKALTAQMGKVLGDRTDTILERNSKIDLGEFEVGSINAPNSSGNITNYADNTRIRMVSQLATQDNGDYTIKCAQGFEFLIYISGVITTAEWRTSLDVTLTKGVNYRIALRQVPAVNYQGYTSDQIMTLVENSMLIMFGPNRVPHVEGTAADTDLDIADEKGFVVARFAKGHIKTKYFDSSNIHAAGGKTPYLQDMGLPRDVPKVNIVSELLTPDASNNTIAPLSYTGAPTWEAGEPVGSVDTDDVIIEFSSQSINFTDRIEINYQGHTSLADAQKAFGIDTAHKHKFGKWLEFDSFHLKAFYEDFIKCRDWVCNQMMGQIYATREATEERPFLAHNDFPNNYRGFFGANALCRVDGFPIELYINGVYWGLYVWRLKKHRDNYQFNKSDTDHIFLDAQDWFSNSGAFSWSGVEIRNPKSDSGNPSFPEGVEPNAGPVKTAIVSWETALWGITSSTPKSSIEQILDIREFIDCYLLMYVCNVWDSWARNTLYGSWDGQHFAPMVYDMNNSFNGFGGKNTGPYTPYYPPTSDTYNQKARSMSWFVALEAILANDIRDRYKELQSFGVFTVENIVGLFDEWAEWVGFNAYARHASRWPDCPSYIGTNRDIDKISVLRDWVSQRIAFLNEKYL